MQAVKKVLKLPSKAPANAVIDITYWENQDRAWRNLNPQKYCFYPFLIDTESPYLECGKFLNFYKFPSILLDPPSKDWSHPSPAADCILGVMYEEEEDECQGYNITFRNDANFTHN